MSLPTHLRRFDKPENRASRTFSVGLRSLRNYDTIRPALAGRRVLVTGAGGSIGSEICRQISGLNPDLLGAP